MASTTYGLDGDERIVKVERFMVANVVPGRHLSISFDPSFLAAAGAAPSQRAISVVVASQDDLATEIAATVIAGDERFKVLARSELDRLKTVVLGHRPDVAVIVQSPFALLGQADNGDTAATVEELSRFIDDNSLPTYTLVINNVNRPDLARDALMAGATGVFGLDAGMAELSTAITEVAEGHSYMSARLTRQVFSNDGDGLASLTPRERQVLKRIALGYTNKECAEELFLSVRTVEKHHANLKKRLGLDTRRELVAYALRNNVLFSAAAWVASAFVFI